MVIGDQSPKLDISGALWDMYRPVLAPVEKPSVVLVILGAWLFLGEHLTPVKIVEGR